MTKDINKVYVLGYTPFKCYRDFWFSIILIIAALIIPLGASIGIIKPGNETINIWFQRSGSITVLLSLVAEYVISRLHGIIRPAGLSSTETEKIRKKLENPLMILRYIGGAVAVAGTIIWGYGDILI
ncbi:MAG: hypothetical protein V7745_00525 [Pseudomonadales bacterium]